MAGGSEAGYRDLSQTPTWAVAAVCAVIIFISIVLEKLLHHIGEWFTRKRKKALFEALEKVKAELMVLGFISLLLSFGQSYIAKICIPEGAASTMTPCSVKKKHGEAAEDSQHRRLLFDHSTDMAFRPRVLSEENSSSSCADGKVPIISTTGIHQLHIFIFFLAVFQVMHGAVTMALGRAKIRRWKEWEKETSSLDYEFSNDPSRFRFAHETSFVKQHSTFWSRIPIPFFFYIVSFIRQFFRSVRKADYLAMRHGFISAHLAPGTKFNFQNYIKRTLEDDFKVVVGISPVLWASAVVFLLLNVHGWQTLFWVSIIPLVIILSVGTKLQAIITQMALEISERHIVIQGIPLVKPTDHHFWFGRPALVLHLIHFTLFQNSFQIIYFLWIWYEFGLRSCFHDNFKLIIARVCLGVGVQFLCSYVTLPLYALVSQMGSRLKRSIFDDQINRALEKWQQAAKRRHGRSSTTTPSEASPYASPGTPSAGRQLQRFKTTGHLTNASNPSRRGHQSFNSRSDNELDAPVPPLSEQLHVHHQHEPEEDFSFARLPPTGP